MAFSPDGKTVATDSRMGITLWSVDEGRSKIVLEDSTNLFAGRRMWFQPERSLAFSPDGQYLVAARNTLSDRGVFVLSVWDVASGKEQWVMPDDPEHIEHTGLISALAFSPDGFTLATASMDYSIRLWNFTNQQRIATFQGHLNEVWSLAFAPDGRTLVSGAKNGEVKLWPTRPQRKDEVLAGLRQPLAFSKDGRTLAALAREGAVVFVNVTTGETEQQFPLERNRARFGPFAPAVSISQDLRTLAQGCDDGTVKLWDTGTREATALKVCDGPVELVALSPDAQRLITRGRDWTLRRWDLRTGSGTVWTAEVFKVLFSPDGHTLATFGRGNSVQFWDAASLSPRTNLVVEEQLNFPPPPAAFSPDGRVFALAAQDDTIRLWEAATAKPLGTCTGHKQGVSSIVFSPDGKTLATASDDSTLKLWNLATQQELLTIRRLGGALRGLLFSPDGQLLVGGSSLSARSGGLRLHRAPLFSTTDAGDSQSPRQDAER
jgi:WD40 repeat protein